MREDRKGPAELDRDEGDDIEIIEVVGLNEDAPPPSDEDPEEIEVHFEGGGPRPAPESAAEGGVSGLADATPSAVALIMGNSLIPRMTASMKKGRKVRFTPSPANSGLSAARRFTTSFTSTSCTE